MSTDESTDDLGNRKVPLSDGSALFALPHDPGLAADSIKEDIGQKTDTGAHKTPDPTSSDEELLDPQEDGGPLRRFTDIKSPLGQVGLESLAKDEDEVAKAISARSDEIYRNEFPVIVPKYEAKCLQCGAEYGDEDVEECRECDGTELETPDPRERREIRDYFESINKEGQSMRQLGKITDEDHSRLGVLCWVLRWNYLTAPQPGALDEGKRVVSRRFQELVRGDPKRIVPVVDANGRIGNLWWTCPIHRQEAVVNKREYEEDGVTSCTRCGCDLQEVHYVELDGAGGRELEKYYFEHEIVMYAGHIPQAHGLDGLSPVHLVWLEQAILHWMDVYAAEFFNPHSERTPNKFLIVHTANPESFEEQLDEAKDDASSNPYKSGIFYNQLQPDQSSNTEAQVIDVMGDEFLGQSEDLRKRYESHIRTVFGVTDVFDSELEDAGGLNNEGLQLEVTDRSIAAAQQDYADGPYDELLSYLGYDDWMVKFVPPREQDLAEQREAVRLLREAAEIGLPARMENGEPVIGDGDAQPPTPSAPGEEESEDGLDGDPDDLAAPPLDPDEDGESDGAGGSGNSKQADGDEEHLETLRTLGEAQKHLTWHDPHSDPTLGQKASEPFWDRDEDVPELVKQAITDALRAGAISAISENLPSGVTRLDVESFFREKLTQPQGWSLESLATDYANEFDVDREDAVQAVRRQTKSVLDKGRELGYEQQTGDTTDRVFKWVGPIDDRKTEASMEVLEKTNPDHGGTPRPLPELKQIVREAREKHFPELTGAEWADSWQDRDTFVEHFD